MDCLKKFPCKDIINTFANAFILVFSWTAVAALLPTNGTFASRLKSHSTSTLSAVIFSVAKTSFKVIKLPCIWQWPKAEKYVNFLEDILLTALGVSVTEYCNRKFGITIGTELGLGYAAAKASSEILPMFYDVLLGLCFGLSILVVELSLALSYSYKAAVPPYAVSFLFGLSILASILKAFLAAGSGEVPSHIRAYDDAIEESLSKWTQLTDQIGGDIVDLKPKILVIFDGFRNYLWTAAGKPKPSAADAQKVLQPVINLVLEINSIKETQRNTALNHLTCPTLPQNATAQTPNEQLSTRVRSFSCGDSTSAASAAAAGSGEVPSHIRAYDDAIEESLSKWTQLTDQIGGDIVDLKPKVLAIFDGLRNYLWSAAGKPEPSAADAQKMLQPVIDLFMEINTFKDTKRNTAQSNHLNSIAEALPALGWVTVKKTPAPYIKEYIEAAQFYINPILRQFKETDPKHVEWTKAWKGIFEEMQKFVRQVHTTGLVWNSAPGAAPSGSTSAAPAAPPAPKGPGGPPPPPPPPPADFFANIAPPPVVDADKSNRDVLFAALNKGEGITSGLKKVTADMQTHKNPGLRGNVAAPATVSKAAGGSPAKAAAPVRKPPNKELENGKQWIVEYFVNDPNIVIDVHDKKQTIYIFRCENSVIKVNGKANSITLDGCKKTSIVFDALVAQCETVNCQSVQIQTLGELPTLSIQKTDECQVFLSKVAQACEIVTSKSSEINISVQTTDDGEYSEFPVPEQFKTTFVNGKLVTVVSDIC